jgi:hypothetical protein
MSDLLFLGGIIIAAVSVATGVVFIAVLWVSKRRLNAKLDAEYGKRL